MATTKKETVGIIGYGRFGRLWATVVGADHDVLVYDIEPMDQTTTLEDLCARSSTIFLCVPINQFDDVVQSIAGLIRPSTTIFDTCSVKMHPAGSMQKHLGNVEDVTLVATHPMFGPDSAANGVKGLSMMMSLLQGDETRYDQWREEMSKLGIRVVEMSPAEHDRLAAYSQGVTHYVGRLLEQLELQETPIDTQGFKILRSLIEQTCNDSFELFRDLQTYNSFTSEMRQKMEIAVDKLNRELGE